jgi:hypothetical protein
MGLENYNMSVIFGDNSAGGLKEYLTYTQVGNIRKFRTGLDEKASELLKIEDDSEKNAKIESIKATKEWLNSTLGYTDEMLESTNFDFWSTQFIEIRTPIYELNLSKPEDLIKYYCLKARGYDQIATSYEEAKNSPKIYKFYLHEEEEVLSIQVELTKIRNKAISKITELYEEDPQKLIFVGKYTLPSSKGYKLTTITDLVYKDLDMYIRGDISVLNLKEYPQKVLKACDLSKSDLRIICLVKDAIHYKDLYISNDNMYINKHTQTICGRNENEIIEYLKNPINNDELIRLEQVMEHRWK